MENYQVKDIYEASFLHAKGLKFEGLKDAGRFVWFVFGNKGECEILSKTYWSGDALVNAKTFADSFRTLKDRLFANK